MDNQQDDTLPMDGGAEPIVDQPKFETEPRIEEPAQAQGRERDEHGRFKAKDTGDTPQGDEATPAKSPIPEEEFKGYLAEKRKRQELEEKLAALEQRLPQQPAPTPPDIWEDPEGRLGVERQQTAQELYQQRYFMSQKLAEIQHGQEAVAEAVNWATERATRDPQFNSAALTQMDPVGWAIEQHRREKMASVSPEDFAAFQAWREMQSTQPQAKPFTPPTSTVQDGSVAGRSGPVWGGPTPDKQLLSMG